MARLKDRKRKDWYSISVDTLRNVGLLLALVALGAGGFRYYRAFEERALGREAERAIGESRTLLDRLKRIASPSQAGELQTAQQQLTTAEQRFQERRFHEAVISARACKWLLQSLLDASASGAGGAARFIGIQGEVEYRRGESGDWLDAKTRVTLKPGDYVRTSDGGSAEIVFADGTLYTVRPNTQVIVAAASGRSGQDGQSIRMDYGWVDLSTRQRASRVVTPGAQARIRERSEAFVSYDRTARQGRFGAVAGGVEVAASSGVKQTLGPLEQVVQLGDQLAAPDKLPDPPRLSQPNDNLEIELERTPSRTLVLRWEAVPAAAGYALQVGRNHLFVDNVVDDPARAKTSASLGLRGEGSFFWRVAAIDRNKLQGPWSEPRRFRVASIQSAAPNAERDTKPPRLDLDDIKPYGTILIVSGRTEPGARVSINGEPVEVDLDGAFNKAIQIAQEGSNTLEIRAADAHGNATVERKQVFVEGS